MRSAKTAPVGLAGLTTSDASGQRDDDALFRGGGEGGVKVAQKAAKASKTTASKTGGGKRHCHDQRRAEHSSREKLSSSCGRGDESI